MSERQPRRIIVALGTDHTGSLLLMQVLERLGMTVPAVETPANEQNPKAGYEDSEIFSLHSEMLDILKTTQHIPLPEGWLTTQGLTKPKNKLGAIVHSRVSEADTIFGFKDPRTALFLPLWKSIFDKYKIVPSYIVAVRNPASTVLSLKAQCNHKESISELFWLNNYCESFENTSANCYIVHYEDWFKHSHRIVHDLLEYTNLGNYFTGDANAVVSDVVNSMLESSSSANYQVQNEHVRKFYSYLKTCSGHDFDKATFMRAVNDARQAMDDFKGWYLLAHTNVKGKVHFQEEVAFLKEKLSEQRRRYSELQEKIKAERGARLHDVNEHDGTIRTELEQEEQQKQEKIQEVNEYSEKAQEQLHIQGMLLDERVRRVSDLQQKNARFKENDEAKHEENNGFSESVDELKLHLVEAEQLLTESRIHLERIFQREAQWKIRFIEKKKRCDILLSDVERLRAEKTEINKQFTQVQSDLEKAEEVNDTLRLELETAEIQIEKQTAQLSKQHQSLEHDAKIISLTNIVLNSVLKHFIYSSKEKKRIQAQMKLVEKSKLFDKNYYLKNYPDVKNINIEPLHHFVAFGWAEFRNPNELFDSFYYLDNNRDVLTSGTMNPLIHFIQIGWKENRNPSPNFNIAFYLENNPEVKQAGMNPLEHFLHYGKAE